MIIQRLTSAITSTTKGSLSRVSMPRFRNAEQDYVIISDGTFTPLETRLMAEVREYTKEHGVETLRIIDRKGKQLKLILKETEGHVSGEFADIEPVIYPNSILRTMLSAMLYQRRVSKSTQIHSHPVPVPLSGEDVLQMLLHDVKKEVATIPNGGYSSLEIPDFAKFYKYGDAPIEDADNIKFVQHNFAININMFPDGVFNMDNVSPDNLAEYNSFLISTWQAFANKYGLKFSHKGFE